MINIDSRIAALKEHVVGLRRSLHKIPEIGLFEHETTEFILKYLRGLGIKAEVGISGTGVIGYVDCDSSSTVAYRADIDALTVDEKTGVEFCSSKQGFMHACGHDGHMSILLGFAKFLSENKSSMDKNVLLIFQPAEEGPGGALPLVESGLLEKHKVEAIFGLHVFPDVEEGMIGCKPGPMMAQTGEFDIRITGKSCHGAMPNKGHDAMNAAVSAVAALNSVIGRNIDPIEPAVLNVGRLICGERRNILAGDALLEGTMRAFNSDTYNCIRNRIIKITESLPQAFDCEAEYEIRDMYPAVCNDSGLYDMLVAAVGQENVEVLRPLTISEDFSYYQDKVPGLFFMLGSRNESMGYNYPLHSNRFNFNEDILILGIQVFYNIYQKLQL